MYLKKRLVSCIPAEFTQGIDRFYRLLFAQRFLFSYCQDSCNSKSNLSSDLYNVQEIIIFNNPQGSIKFEVKKIP